MNTQLPFGPLMLDLQGLAVASSEIDKLRHPGVGGVILFSRNYESVDQIHDLVRQIRALRGREFLIAVDQEGGRVQRFQDGFTRLPAADRYAKVHSENKSAMLQSIESAGWIMAAELLVLGIDFSFAPVLDVDCGISAVIGDRSFASHPSMVSDCASAFRRGMSAAGMAAVGKHFPGHGGVALDSHLTLPVDDRDWELINRFDLLPFKKLIVEGIEGIMPAHVVYSKIDRQPAGFSEHWIKKVLRSDLGFDGAVFSDDLSMSGAESIGNYAQRVERAISAGCDMVLICNQPQAAENVLELCASHASEDRQRRLLKMCGKPVFDGNALKQLDQWQTGVQSLRQLEPV